MPFTIALYMDGQKVFFKHAVPEYSPANDNPVLRAIPILASADMKAHPKIGLTTSGGKNGCQRCTVVGDCVFKASLLLWKFPVSLPFLTSSSISGGKS